MARKRMKPKIQPAEMTMVFDIPTIQPDEDATYFIDISQCASLINRRFYRQGLNWAVGDIKVRCLTAPTPVHCEIQVQRLPNTWVMSNAWEKGFRAWQHMIKNATDDSGLQSIKGKFLDFKVFANERHHAEGVASNLIPIDSEGNQANRGQWDMSTVELNAGPGFPAQSFPYEIIAVGPNSSGAGASGLNAKSLINGYSSSRALPYSEDPNVPADADSTSENWLLSIFNEGTTQDEEVVEMLTLTGDKAPYPYEGDGTNTDTMYPGGANQLPALAIHDESALTGTTIGSIVHLNGGNFPCGLMGLRFNNFVVFDPTGVPYGNSVKAELQITLVPGNHRGYLAESMTEM